MLIPRDSDQTNLCETGMCRLITQYAADGRPAGWPSHKSHSKGRVGKAWHPADLPEDATRHPGDRARRRTCRFRRGPPPGCRVAGLHQVDETPHNSQHARSPVRIAPPRDRSSDRNEQHHAALQHHPANATRPRHAVRPGIRLHLLIGVVTQAAVAVPVTSFQVGLTHQHTNHSLLVEGPEITVRPVGTVARASSRIDEGGRTARR